MHGWPLIGRDAELDVVEALTSGADAGSVVLAGAAGVGKTRLATEALRRSESKGLFGLRVVASRSAASMPFGAFVGLLPQRIDERDDELALLHRVTEVIRERSGGRRILLSVDDAHLLDDPSATLVHHLATSQEASLLVTIRTGESPPDAITLLWKDGLAERIELQPLSRAEVGDLASVVLGGDLDARLVERLWSASQGNPLYLRELISGARAEGVIAHQGGLWRITGRLRAPARLAELIELRLSALPPGDCKPLDLLAVAEDLGLATLEAQFGSSVLDRLERDGLLVVSSDGRRHPVRLAHPLYSEVLIAAMSAVRVASLKRTVASLIEDAGARRRRDVLRVALLRLDADGKAPLELLLGAVREVHTTYDAALVERLTRAAVDAGAGWDTRWQLAETLRYAGRFDEAEELLSTIDLESVDSDEARSLVAMTRADMLFEAMARDEDAMGVLRDAAARVTSEPWKTWLAAFTARLDVFAGRIFPALEIAEAITDRAPDAAMLTASVACQFGMSVSGRFTDALELADRAFTAANTLERKPKVVAPEAHLTLRTVTMVFAGRLAEVEAEAGPLYDWAVSLNVAQGRAWLGLVLAYAALAGGRPTRAEHLFREAGAAAAELNDYGVERLSWAGAAHAAALRADVASAETSIRELEAVAPSAFVVFEVEVDRGCAWTYAARAEIDRARETLLAAAARARSLGQFALEAEALHDVVRLGDPRAAAPRLAELRSIVEGPVQPVRDDHAAALATSDAEALDRVSHEFEDLSHVLLAAEAAAQAADTFRRSGRQRQASAAALRAKELAARCEGSRTPALTDPAGVVPLTRREREIGSLAAEGLSSKDIADRLYLSARTVENHLQRVYEKLGVSGRAELAARLKTE